MNGPINKGVSSALPRVFYRNRRGEGPGDEVAQLIARSPQASPADVIRALDPDLLSRGREPEHCNFKRS